MKRKRDGDKGNESDRKGGEARGCDSPDVEWVAVAKSRVGGVV